MTENKRPKLKEKVKGVMMAVKTTNAIKGLSSKQSTTQEVVNTPKKKLSEMVVQQQPSKTSIPPVPPLIAK